MPYSRNCDATCVRCKSVVFVFSYLEVNLFSFLDNSLFAAICLLKNTVGSRRLGEASHASAGICLLKNTVNSRRLGEASHASVAHTLLRNCVV